MFFFANALFAQAFNPSTDLKGKAVGNRLCHNADLPKWN
jgi:hypothetical protein